MSRCVVVGAAEITNYKKIKEFLNSDDFVIYCDGGLKHREKLNLEANLIIGDFDSFDYSQVEFSGEIIRLPCEKDDTDTFFAVKEAVKRGYSDFLLIGVIGQRFDHSLCNISILLYLHQLGKSALLLDDYSEMKLVGGTKKTEIIENSYKYFSLMCVDGSVTGISIKNAKYPLENATINTSYQFGISNEVLPDKKAEVFVENGILLLIKVW